jgi:hypothetical protein
MCMCKGNRDGPTADDDLVVLTWSELPGVVLAADTALRLGLMHDADPVGDCACLVTAREVGSLS